MRLIKAKSSYKTLAKQKENWDIKIKEKEMLQKFEMEGSTQLPESQFGWDPPRSQPDKLELSQFLSERRKQSRFHKAFSWPDLER